MTALGDAVLALRRADPAEALAALDALDQLGAPAAARAMSLRAQALFELGRLPEAVEAVHRAAAAVKRLGDARGLAEVRALRAQILATAAGQTHLDQQRARAAALTETPTELLLAAATTPQEAAEALIRKADALATAGRLTEAAELAQSAIAKAPDTAEPARVEVLALLVLVRSDPSRSKGLLARARDIADAADERQLITAVAHAARAAGVSFPPEVF